MEKIFDQSPFQCRMDWSTRGVEGASKRGDIIIVIDVLRFSSAIVNAVHNRTTIYPFPRTGDIVEYGKLVGAEVYILESYVAKKMGLPSLSVTSYNESHKGKRYVLSSINGATCTKAATEKCVILIGCLLNITAVANAANKLRKETGANITVIACGERWNSPSDEYKELRPGIEDYLVAGAILKKLEGTKSPEAKVCISAYKGSRPEMIELIMDSGSSRELLYIDFADDVKFSCQLDVFKDVPILVKDDIGQMNFKNYN
jgi:2-phosphosulfolactate phosphatase